VARLRLPHLLLVWPVGLVAAYGFLELNALLNPPKWIAPATFQYVTHAILRHPLVGIAYLLFPVIPAALTLVWAVTSVRRHSTT
jgi:hypothetical protein